MRGTGSPGFVDQVLFDIDLVIFQGPVESVQNQH